MSLADDIWECSAENARRLAAQLRHCPKHIVVFPVGATSVSLILGLSARYRRLRDALSWDLEKLLALPREVLSAAREEFCAMETLCAP